MNHIQNAFNETDTNFSNEANKNDKDIININKDKIKIINYRINNGNMKLNNIYNRYNSFINKNSKKDNQKKKNIVLFKKERLFILMIVLFLLNINGISCQSHIIVKINKAGRYKILYNGGVEDTGHWCYTVPNHTPIWMTINGDEVDTSLREYDFTQQENTIKLYYEDSKYDFKCLFYGCSDIDEIDASNLITYSAIHMQYMFYLCSSLTSLNLNNFNTENVVYMRYMFGFCSSLFSIDVSHFATPLLIDIAFMFEGCSNLTSIYLLNFDTKEVVAMDRLFKGCTSLTTLDITNFKTSKAKWMGEMFGGCSLLTTLDLSHFDTSSVEYFDGMFDSCRLLTSLNLSNFYTGKAITMHAMFNGCNNLKYLDIHSFNTSLVYDMGWMFCGCLSLESLDLTNFNTANVVNMRIMFGSCASLVNLDLTYFDTPLVTDVAWMFHQCRNLIYINLSNFNFKLTTEFDYMFDGCISLKTLDFTQFKTDNARNMRNMFSGCSSLASIDLNNLNTSNVTLMNEMFSGCSSLESLDFSNFDTSKVKNMSSMFRNCENLKSLNLNNFNTLNVENMEWMFYECYKLESLDISSFRTPKVKSMAAMFVRCKSLTTIEVSQFDTSQVTNILHMFEDCPLITSLDLSHFITSSIENMRAMFLNSNKLISLDLSHFDFTQVTDIKHMFAGCSSLKYINIKSLVINDNIEYIEFINNALLNPIICIDDMQSLNKIISLYRCHHLEDPKNWGLYKDNIADDNNIFINNCLLSKNDTNCYQICSFYYYFDESLNKYICTEDLKCPKTYEKLIHGKNECIKSCDETNDHNYELLIGKICLKNCSDNFYEPYDKPFSCIPKCPSDHPFLFVESLECVSYCTIKQRQDKLCVTYYTHSKEVNYQIFDTVMSQTRNELLTAFDLIVVDRDIINENGDNITITRTEKLNDDGIYLGECEERLKNHYNISQNESLYVLRVDIRQIGYNPSLELEILYPIYDSTNLVILNLSLCAGLNLNKTVDADITGNRDKYDKNSAYYNDICYVSDSDNGVDMVLSDKKEDFINNNLGICEDGCEIISYNYETKKAVCSCGIKTEIPLMNDIKIDKETLLNSFTNIDNIANTKLLKCYKTIFQKKYILKNIGFYIFACLIVLDLFCILYFVIKDYNLLIKEFDKIKFYFLNKNKNKKNNKSNNKNSKKNNNKNKIKNNNIKTTNNFKRNKIFINKSNSTRIKHIRVNILNTTSSNNIKSKNPLKNLSILYKPKIKIPQLNNKRIGAKKNIQKKFGPQKNSIIKGKTNRNFNNKSYNFPLINNTVKFNKKRKKKIKNNLGIKLNYNEMNNLEYKDALIKDKRNFSQYYISLLKTKHSLIYIFYKEDYNSKIAKVSIQIFNLGTLIAINALFFNDSTMHKIYTDEGSFNFLYQLPQIIYSTIISSVLNMLVQLLGLTEDNILKFKNDKSPTVNFDKAYKKLISLIRIKFLFFYILSILILVLYWYYVTCFCGIYRNTQIHLLKDSLFSFITSLISPFGIYLLPGMFRISGLKRKSKILYGFSKILQMI